MKHTWIAFLGIAALLLSSCASDQTTSDVRPSRPSPKTSSSTRSTSLAPPRKSLPPPVTEAPRPVPSPPPSTAPGILSEAASVPAHIGLIIPMSGSLAPIGEQLLRSVRLGLNLEKGFDSAFQLFIVDSELPEAQLREEIENLIYRAQVMAMMSAGRSQTLISEIAEQTKTPVVLFSQRSIPADATETFRNFLTSESQILYLVSELRAQGAQRFAVLYPNDHFGTEATNFFWNTVLASGGQVTAAESYETKEHDFRVPVQRLVGLDDLAARDTEYKEKLKAWRTQNQGKKISKEPTPTDLLEPWVDFDAVFIPDGVQNLGQITAMLSFQNVRNLKIVGLNLWDTPELTKRVDGKFNPILFVDDFSNLDSTGQASQLAGFYRTHFETAPQSFDVLGFETATVFRKIMGRNIRSRDSFREALAKFSDPSGMFGPVSVSPGREFDRAMGLYSFNGSSITKLP